MEAPGTVGRIPATRNTVTGAFMIRATVWLNSEAARLDKNAAIMGERPPARARI